LSNALGTLDRSDEIGASSSRHGMCGEDSLVDQGLSTTEFATTVDTVGVRKSNTLEDENFVMEDSVPLRRYFTTMMHDYRAD